MTKLEQLKQMLAQWKESKSVPLAYDICRFLINNLEKK